MRGALGRRLWVVFAALVFVCDSAAATVLVSVESGLCLAGVMMDRYGGSVWFENGDETAVPPGDPVTRVEEPDGAVAVPSFHAVDETVDTVPHDAI
ncbi:MAG: hypothetical protein ACI9CA_000155 [Natronomonas sp.]